MKIVFKQLSPVEHSWLGLEDEFLQIDNHLIHRDEWDIENPGPLELRLMWDSNYLSFAADILLNVQLLPFQAAILEELYSRPFPMLIMARGASKSFLLAVYCLLKMSLHSNQKIVLCAAALSSKGYF